MRNLHLFAAAGAAFVLAGCGGGGSGSSGSTVSTSTGTTVAAPSSTHIEAIVSHLTSYDTVTVNGKTVVQWLYQDPTTIQALDQIQFQLVYYTASNTRVVLPTDQWTTSDTNSSYGTIAYNNGNFQAANATTPAPQTVSVVYNDRVYSTSWDVVPRQVRERGLVQSDASSHTPLKGIEIDFYGFSNLQNDTPWDGTIVQDQNNTGNYIEYTYPTIPNTSSVVFLGRATTQVDGTFRGSVPAGTYGFTLANNSLPSGYQRIFRYRGQLYNTGDITPYGLAPLPTPQPLVTPPSFAVTANPLPDPVPTTEVGVASNYYPIGEYVLAYYLNAYPSTSALNTNPATNGTIELIPTTESVTPPAN
jgi:hypothetical protein